MAISLQDAHDEGDAWLAEINTTPLVDVMLVLLIIFLLTIPVVSATVKVKLPVHSAQRQDTSGEYIVLSVDAQGQLFLNDRPMASLQSISQLLAPAMARSPQPQLHVRADGAAPYAAIAPVIEMAQSMGLAQVSLLTQPARALAPANAAQSKPSEALR